MVSFLTQSVCFFITLSVRLPTFLYCEVLKPCSLLQLDQQDASSKSCTPSRLPLNRINLENPGVPITSPSTSCVVREPRSRPENYKPSVMEVTECVSN